LQAYLDAGFHHGDLFAKNVMFGTVNASTEQLYAVDFGYAGVGQVRNPLHYTLQGKPMTFGDTDLTVLATIEDALAGHPYSPRSCFNRQVLQDQLGQSITQLTNELGRHLCEF
jgi:hypothetical protein